MASNRSPGFRGTKLKDVISKMGVLREGGHLESGNKKMNKPLGDAIHTKYLSSRLCGFIEEEICLRFSYEKLISPWGEAIFGRGSLFEQIM